MKNTAIFKKWGTFSKENTSKSIQMSFANHLEYSLSRDQYTCTKHDLFYSLALAVRDRMVERWIRTQQMYYDFDVKRVYYLSAEYLMGRALLNNIINLGMHKQTLDALAEMHLSLADIAEEEPDAGLGNGGLGRLAACFLDSLATLEIPAYGYGIRYEFGIFEQQIRNLAQIELPDAWLKFGNPWEIARPDIGFTVRFNGRTAGKPQSDGRFRVEWVDTNNVIGIAHDTPIAGYDNNTVNTLRLWASRASKEFDLEYFHHGDYFKAVEEKNVSENISKVLYPNDSSVQGQELRLKQQYFFVSCSIQDIIRRYLRNHTTFDQFPDKVAIQMNDTHPSLAVVELMRLFIDEHWLTWERAWDITIKTCAYTNHTLLSEALEKWPVPMLEKILPRHLEIIFEINRRFMREVTVRYVGDNDRARRMSLVEEGPVKKIRMANLAIVGSHSVNGVAELHTRLLREKELKDFDEFYIGKMNNKTNGVTPRRWLLACNMELADLLTSKLGNDWARDLSKVEGIDVLADDIDFRKTFAAIKRKNKEKLAETIKALTGFAVDPESIYDVQVKRIHEYKRQLLNILHVVYLWLELKQNIPTDAIPRTFIFGGKAAPGYFMAKQIIRLICHVGEMINRDDSIRDLLKVVYLPNYRVSLAEKIFPASDVSEQISTAGFEASGTGNMKFAINGALTVGTLDGANVEIMEEVGRENIFIFGLTADEVMALKPTYNPRAFYEQDPILKRSVDLIADGFFSPEDPGRFRVVIDHLLTKDPYLVLADFDAYRACHVEVAKAYANRERWTRMAIANVARMGKFSSDRTILEYNRDIWKAEPLHITRENRPSE